MSPFTPPLTVPPPLSKPPVESKQPGEETGLEFVFSDEPVIAWRAWALGTELQRPMGTIDRKDEALRLYSVTHKIRWPLRRAVTAHCIQAFARSSVTRALYVSHGVHDCPGTNHRCGVYGVATPKMALGWANISLGVMVVGRVFLWGKVIQHEKGFRAARAYPMDLWVIQHNLSFSELRGYAAELSREYSVPVLIGVPKTND